MRAVGSLRELRARLHIKIKTRFAQTVDFSLWGIQSNHSILASLTKCSKKEIDTKTHRRPVCFGSLIPL